MHHIYHTEGIILSSKKFGEAGKRYWIFTKELGMIRASAQGVLKISSKLRFVLQDFTYVKVDLVQGKDFWRLTSASKTNLLEDVARRPETFAVFSNISRLLTKLLSGEEKNEDLFLDLISGLTLLEKSHTPEEVRNIEAVLVLRILSHLGYIGGEDNIQSLLQSSLEEAILAHMSVGRKAVLSEINRALKATHLML